MAYGYFELLAMSEPEDNWGYHYDREASASDGEQLSAAQAEMLAAEAALAELEDCEPRCNCFQSDVDVFDAIACELHNTSSEWNTRLRAVTMGERYETYMQEVA